MKLISAISKITHDDLVELFSTALYGCEIFVVDWPNDHPEIFKEGDCIEDKLARCLLNDQHIIIGDRYSDEVFYGDLPHRWDDENWCMDYTVKLADIEKGLNKALNYGGWPQKYVYNLCNADEGDFDYPQALCLLQFILFGEEIYG